MKIREVILSHLQNHGLFENEAKAILDRYINGMGESMKNRLDDDESAYPKSVLLAVMPGINHTAVTWIDDNAPMHWVRAMFTDTGDQGSSPSMKVT